MSDKKRLFFSLADDDNEPGEKAIKKERETTNGPVQKVGFDDGLRRVVIVGMDIPFSNIALLVLKILLAVIPIGIILGAVLGIVWKIATHGAL